MSVEKLEVFCPVGEPGAKPVPSASRVQDLNGKIICQVSNGQFQAGTVLSAVGDLIKNRFPSAKVVPWTEFPIIDTKGDVEKRLKETREALQQNGADVVITSTGA